MVRTRKRKVEDQDCISESSSGKQKPEPKVSNSKAKNKAISKEKQICVKNDDKKTHNTKGVRKRKEVCDNFEDSNSLLETKEIKYEEDSGYEQSSPSTVEAKTIAFSTVSKKFVTDVERYKSAVKASNDSSSSESEWEEVEEQNDQDLDDYEPNIPKEGVEITIDCPNLNIRKRKKKQFDEMDYIRLYINRERKDLQLCMHKVHLLCILAHGFYVNDVLNSQLLKCLALSFIPNELFPKSSGKKLDKIDVNGIDKLLNWFCSLFTFQSDKEAFVNLNTSLVSSFQSKKSLNPSEYNLMFIIICRVLGLKTRFCISLYPMTYKAQNLIKKSGNEKNKKKKFSNNVDVEDTVKATSSKKTQLESTGEKSSKGKEQKSKSVQKKKKTKSSHTIKTELDESETLIRPRRSADVVYKISSDESDNDEDKDFNASNSENSDVELDKKRKVNSKHKNKHNIHKNELKSKKLPEKSRKILSSDSESSTIQQIFNDSKTVVCWAEVYSKSEKQWITVECTTKLVNKPSDIERLLPQPLTYILAYDNESYVKDVTRRYCEEFMTSTRKLRVDAEWWEETIEPFSPPNSKLDREEEKKLDEILMNKPMPTTVAGFKNHPLYALKRHLLKFEGIYPSDAAPVGFFRKEPVYARDCVCQLHSRETWLKEARVVRIGEEPYKIVKARPKWDKIAGVMRTDLPLEIFGMWQTEPYEPPIAVDGKVPRNEYGNVELFKPCMLPKGTVHLQIPCLNRIARKLGIDCSPAVVGFDGHKGSVHPVFDGFVVCEEFKDTLLAAWDEEQVNAQKREKEKREKRIYGNWKKLIKGLLIRERIKLKYDVK